MAFFIRFFIFISITSQVMAFESILPPSKRVITETEMDYSYSDLNPSDRENIFIHHESLEKLDMRYVTFTDDQGNSMVDNFDQAMPAIMDVHFPRLKELYFDWSRHKPFETSGYCWANYDESPLIFISHQTNLEVLSLNGWDFGSINRYGNTDYRYLRDFRILSTLTHLTSLTLKFASFLPENCEQFQYILLPNLENFNADSSNVKAVAWDLFAPNIRFLSLANSEINGTDLIHISKLPHLEKLNIANTNIRGGSIKKLAQLPHLKELNLSEVDMTKTDFSGLQMLKFLDLSNCKFSIASFLSLQSLQNLEKLNLKGLNKWGQNPNIDTALIQQLQDTLPNCQIEL